MADSGSKKLTKAQNVDALLQMNYARTSRLAAFGQHWLKNLEENIAPPADFTTTTFTKDSANQLLVEGILGW